MDEVEELTRRLRAETMACEDAVGLVTKALTVSPEKLLDASDAIKAALIERGVSLKPMTADKCARAAAIALGMKVEG